MMNKSKRLPDTFSPDGDRLERLLVEHDDGRCIVHTTRVIIDRGMDIRQPDGDVEQIQRWMISKPQK